MVWIIPVLARVAMPIDATVHCVEIVCLCKGRFIEEMPDKRALVAY